MNINQIAKKMVLLTARGIDGQTINSDGSEVDTREVEYMNVIIIVFWVFINTLTVLLNAWLGDIILYVAHIAAVLLHLAVVNEVANLKLKIVKLARG